MKVVVGPSRAKRASRIFSGNPWHNGEAPGALGSRRSPPTLQGGVLAAAVDLPVQFSNLFLDDLKGAGKPGGLKTARLLAFLALYGCLWRAKENRQPYDHSGSLGRSNNTFGNLFFMFGAHFLYLLNWLFSCVVKI
jgi:hypothetical protein